MKELERRQIKKSTETVYEVESEPGDATHYSFFLMKKGGFWYVMRNNGSITYPNLIEPWMLTAIPAGDIYACSQLAKRFEGIPVNPWTLKEVIATINQIEGGQDD